MTTPAKTDSVKQLTDVVNAAKAEITKHITETSVAAEAKQEAAIAVLNERIARLESIIDTIGKAAPKKAKVDAPAETAGDQLVPADKAQGKQEWFISRWVAEEDFRKRYSSLPNIDAVLKAIKAPKKGYASPEERYKKEGRDAHTHLKKSYPNEYKQYEGEHAQYQQSTKVALTPDNSV